MAAGAAGSAGSSGNVTVTFATPEPEQSNLSTRSSGLALASPPGAAAPESITRHQGAELSAVGGPNRVARAAVPFAADPCEAMYMCTSAVS